MTPTEKDILGRLDERSKMASVINKSIKEDIEGVLQQLTKLNGKIAAHEEKIQQIQLKMAVSSGHWRGVSWAIGIVIAVSSIIGGAVATMLWH